LELPRETRISLKIQVVWEIRGEIILLVLVLVAGDDFWFKKLGVSKKSGFPSWKASMYFFSIDSQILAWMPGLIFKHWRAGFQNTLQGGTKLKSLLNCKTW